jgi:hypothetical protein
VSPTEVSSKGNDQMIFDVQGKLKRAGYATVTALAQIENLATQPSDLLGFNIESDQVSSRNISRQARNNVPGIESIEDHAKNLPVVSDFSLHVEQVKADLTNLDDVRQDYRYDGIQFMNLDGTLRNPEKMTIGYDPETGQGQPLPGELEGYANQKSTVRRQTRSWCGSQPAKLHVDLTNIYSNIPNPPIPGRNKTLIPNNFYVKIVDDNGIMPHVVVAEGQLDSNGDISYIQPLCDTFSPFWGDYSPPDIYFLVEARIPANNSNGYHEAIRVVDTFGSQHYFRSGTYWESPLPNFSLNIDVTAYWAHNALWVAKMTQPAEDFVAMASYRNPGVAIFWPATTTFLTGDTAFAPVTRIILPGVSWLTGDPLIHEYGHNVKYYFGNQSLFASCLGAFGPCNPNFAPITDYSHYPEQSISLPKAVNEGFAEYFYEMVKDAYPQLVNTNRSSPIPTYQANRSDFIYRACNLNCYLPTGPGNEARISTFLYRYTNEILNCSQYGNSPAGRFRQLIIGLNETFSYDAGIFDLWNNYLYRSFPRYDYCLNQSNLSVLRDKFLKIIKESTIVNSSGVGSNGEVLWTPQVPLN